MAAPYSLRPVARLQLVFCLSRRRTLYRADRHSLCDPEPPPRVDVRLALRGLVRAGRNRILLELQIHDYRFSWGTAGLLLLVDGLQRGGAPRWSLVIAGFAFTALMVMIREPVAPMLVMIALPFLIERLGPAGWRRLLGVGLACAALFPGLAGNQSVVLRSRSGLGRIP